MKEKILWGVKTGDEDWQEQVLCTQATRFEEVKILAAKDGFGRFRVSEIDFSKRPDFTQALKTKGRRDK